MGEIDRMTEFVCKDTGVHEEIIVIEPALFGVDDDPPFGDRPGGLVGPFGAGDAEHVRRSAKETLQDRGIGIIDEVNAAAVVRDRKLALQLLRSRCPANRSRQNHRRPAPGTRTFRRPSIAWRRKRRSRPPFHL